MIRFSFSSFYMSMIFSNIVILFLYIAFHNQKLMIKLGLPILSGAVFAAILRMVLPFEFLFLSHNIYFPEIISRMISYFLSPQYFKINLSIWTFVKIVWLIGIAFRTFCYLRTEFKCSKDIKKYSKSISETSSINRIFKQIQQELPKAKYIELRTFPFVQTPSIYGIYKPYILLPEELDLDDKQLYYILRHEISHCLHHDALVKLGVEFLCIVYWWNPLCKFLQRKADMILEMRIDQTIVENYDQKIEYLECLIYVANHISSSPKIKSSRIIPYCNKSTLTLDHRFKMLLNNNINSFYKVKKYIILLFFTVLFILSFIFIFEASYMTPEDNFNNNVPSTNNSYFIEREDGYYDFYINGRYITTEDSLKYYSDDIPVYREEVKPYETD